ncbi:hypothetical protein BDV36DRAFT_136617 [Aspergillus pseudocaelatus]|uniref:Uncharacterized protein n=1 Tax=Aspergillus pseudocaelatus TaxID=1825620 RepID=A0ABQ6WQL2_9EURO|nr:hypothetical protein BDV36DRAFT_136617 [Aspergillus pseudocaelatus]
METQQHSEEGMMCVRFSVMCTTFIKILWVVDSPALLHNWDSMLVRWQTSISRQWHCLFHRGGLGFSTSLDIAKIRKFKTHSSSAPT